MGSLCRRPRRGVRLCALGNHLFEESGAWLEADLLGAEPEHASPMHAAVICLAATSVRTWDWSILDADSEFGLSCVATILPFLKSNSLPVCCW